jgi:KDO2-lipid IV(A) lauroyltransferase
MSSGKIQYFSSKTGIFFLLLLSYLPMWMLYGISNILYIVFYRLIKYRIKVVRANLRNSYPLKSEAELRATERNFYKYLADLVVESVKGFTIGKKELRKRITIDDVEIYDKLHDNGKSAIVVMGHNGNWEWVCRAAPLIMKNNIFVAYKPLSNPYFDRLMYNARTEFGVHQVPMAQIAKVILQQTEPFLLILAADQSPSDRKTSIWVDFLNQETAVLPGVEKLAIKFKLPVIFHEVNKTKRGFYKCKPKYIVEMDRAYAAGEITRLHSGFLEEKIHGQPEIWLWSHKRWKLKND